LDVHFGLYLEAASLAGGIFARRQQVVITQNAPGSRLEVAVVLLPGRRIIDMRHGAVHLELKALIGELL